MKQANREPYDILYARLSQEDEREGESNSIQNQEMICQGGILHFNTALKKRKSINPS